MFRLKGKKIEIFPRKFGFFPYIFLVYMLYPVYYLTKETGVKQILGYLMIVIFLASYQQLYSCMAKRKFTYWLAVQLLIVFIFSLFYSSNFLMLGFFPANFIGWYREKQKFYRGLACLAFVEIAPFIYNIKSLLSPTQLLYIVPFIIIMMLSPFGVRSMNRRMELEKQLDQANQQIEELVKREERVRIARDLHDTLGHTLSLLTLKSQLVQRLITADPNRARSEAKEMEVTSRAALKQVRELVTDMRGATIAEELIQIQQILRAAGITYQYEGGNDFSKITPFTQNIVSMCMREAATNIVKHSRASHCSIAIVQGPEQVRVMVHDDGMGIGKSKSFGNGLKGMEERLALIEGSLHLSPHNGTVVEMRIPVVKKEGVAG
ncbi:sensor histidine kinase [Neobacillus massiliamazoniensis]|uniref:histidine kinase n=1 Tax=Neobacillus massiliamazoniensis TaxID=1499688 RepID=A0A0U1NTR9_9BACI|nr:sensor histidine kinase [Neobacillus massiliamazoniensis]CRK81365.1 signal transduction histidine kinase [Neobacillus massiliamazoniensis]